MPAVCQEKIILFQNFCCRGISAGFDMPLSTVGCLLSMYLCWLEHVLLQTSDKSFSTQGISAGSEAALSTVEFLYQGNSVGLGDFLLSRLMWINHVDGQ